MSNLPERLKVETRSLHTQLERGALMRSLLRGEMSRMAYALLLRNLHAVYAALEPLLARHADRPAVAAVYFPVLFRTQALVEDLRELCGEDWAEALALMPAALHYADHLNALAEHHAELLVAHAYVRYLGDLSGGQQLRRVVARSLQLSQGRGTSFYDFGNPAEVVLHLQAFRSGLVQVSADAIEVEALVAEAILAFQLHERLFEELAAVQCAGALSATTITAAS